MKRRGLVLDRDGVVNVDTGFLHRIEECRFVDGIFDLVGDFAMRGFRTAIVTNQSGIGRGLYTEVDYRRLMTWMEHEFDRRGYRIDAVYHCPYHPTAGIGPYRRESDWRKPAPGMILQAAIDLDLDLGRSWLIGDQPTDIAAGRAAGVGTLVRLEGEPDPARSDRSPTAAAQWRDDCFVAGNLGAVRRLLAEREPA